MIKRVIAITIAVAFVLSQSVTANAAFTVDKRYGGPAGPEKVGDALVASVDLYTGISTVANLVVDIKEVDSPTTSATELGWTGVTLGVGWEISDHFVEVQYGANQVGWGVQIYTDNMGTAVTADPEYPGDPTTNPNEQPAGLVGDGEPGTGLNANPYLTCPVAILVTGDTPGSGALDTPAEDTAGTPGQPDFVKFFTSGYDEDTGTTGIERAWFWLKDLSSTKWDDTIGTIVGTIEPGELVNDFSPTGDNYATIVNTWGSSSGWVHPTTLQMQMRSGAGTTGTLGVYVAANFATANEKQVYKTGTLTLELYHQ